MSRSDEDGSSDSGDSVTEGSAPPRVDVPSAVGNKPISSTVITYFNDCRRMAKKKSPTVYIFLAIFALISVGLIVFILVREMTIVQHLQQKCGSEAQFLEYKYPGYFRTEQQQQEFVEALQELERASINNIETVEGASCQFQCNAQEPPIIPVQGGFTNAPARRRKRDTSIQWTYHSCCQSYKNVSSSPQFREDITGRMRELVQTDQYKQYFREETCLQVPRCQGCTCAQPDDDITQAVVYKNKNALSNDEKYELQYLKFAGCCKCLNIGAPRN